MTFQTQGQSFNSLQKQKSRKRRDRRPCITEQDGTDISHKSGRTCCFHKRDSVVAWIRCCNCRIFSTCFPVKFTGIYNNASQGRTMTSKEFGGRMYYNVCTMLYGTDQIRCAKGIVYNQRQTVFMSKGSQSVYIRDITVGISEGFNINGPCILPDCRLYFCKIMDIYKGCSNSEVRKRMGKQVVAATINGFLCDKMYFCKIMDIYKGCSNSEVRKRMGKQVVAATINGFLCDKMASVLPQSLKSIGNCRCAGSKGKGSYTAFQSRDPLFQNILRRICQTSVSRCAGSKGKGSYTAFQSRDPLFQNILRRICQTSVNISCIGKIKPRRRMSRIFKNIRSGGIDRYCTGIRGRIGIFLSYMKL